MFTPSGIALERSIHGARLDCHLQSYLPVGHLVAIAQLEELLDVEVPDLLVEPAQLFLGLLFPPAGWASPLLLELAM